jgi:hypothetical protein
MNYPGSIRIALVAVFVAFFAIATVAAAPRAIGKLRTRDNKPVNINGVQASTGASIFSGAEIECPEGVGATIELTTLGRIDISPKAKLVITFADGSVHVELTSGCVVLTTNKGVDGTVDVAGATSRTDIAKLSSVSARSADSNCLETAGVPTGGSNGSMIGIVGGGIGAGVAGAAAAAGGRGGDVSPAKP